MSYPRIISHRGGGKLAPENTLAGLELAARLGCRAVEFDVRLTADGEPVLLHDETLRRTAGVAGSVLACTLRELRACAPLVPTLDEALDLCRRHRFWVNVEIKASKGRESEIGRHVGQWLAKHWDGFGVVSSFSLECAIAARRCMPQGKFALLTTSLPEDWRCRCAEIRACAVHLAARHADPMMSAWLRQAALPWACYTVNQRWRAERLFALGCAAIITDRPDRWRPEEM
ncbi:MAG: glycerophosphodiester phosphodiesterase family protein [Rhodocyclaceae bacterium]|nr:glycerophosphodiester phosphodiesterase family protein [Rhodocyclaceae bacterium]